MNRLGQDVLKDRVINAARTLNSEIERYREYIRGEIEFKKRLVEIEDNEGIKNQDISLIKTLKNSIPEQLSIQLKRWLKVTGVPR